MKEKAVIDWKEPPVQKNRNWQTIASEIKSRPGSWAFIGEMGVSAAYRYAKAYDFEIRVANRNGSRAEIYMKTN